MEKSYKETVVLYHGNCFDGFGAAYAAWKKFGEEAEYIPMAYSDALPNKQIEMAKKIYLLDYSRKKEELLELNKKVSVTVIDHHKTAKEDLDQIKDQVDCIFNMEKSGAVMAWEYFHQDKKIPKLLLHIQDRDLWRFDLEDTKRIHAALCSMPFDFKIWDEVVYGLDSPDDFIYSINLKKINDKGQTILDYHEQLVDRFCEEANLVTIAGHEVPIVNTSILFSEVPHKLLDLFPNSPFAAYSYTRKDGVTTYGLRGRNTDDFDVSEVAKKFGGGGHKKASGFEIKILLPQDCLLK